MTTLLASPKMHTTLQNNEAPAKRSSSESKQGTHDDRTARLTLEQNHRTVTNSRTPTPSATRFKRGAVGIA